MSAPLTAHQIWRMPVVLGLVSLVGLLAALLGDGVWDVVSWVSLGMPILVMAWFVASQNQGSAVDDSRKKT